MALATNENKVKLFYNSGNIGPDGKPYSDDSILVKFVLVQALALLLASIHGVFQRLPFMADWLRGSDYGGHLFTNLGLTHINVVLGGTVSIAGITYYILPRVLERPLYSKTLCNVGFWFTVCGVFGFYCALLPIGLAEGQLVHDGYTYQQAKDIVGFWHKFPEAVTASCMGIGYWVYVTNVVMTIWQSRNDASTVQRFTVKFHLVASVALLLGTLQGVYQVLPWSLDWLYKTGAAGQLIDPASHAHMNLVGGVIFAFMGFLYYFLPRITGHSIYSIRLANFSFWTLFAGVFSFWLTLITLGFIEGDMVISKGITPVAAREQLGIWHPLPIAIAGSIMAVGFWTFIANILLTLRKGLGQSRERFLAVFLGLSCVALFISTSQGIIQILPSTNRWLEEAREAGELILPMSHAQMNIVGVVTLTLTTIVLFALPRMVDRPLFSLRLAKVSQTFLVVGVSVLYVGLLWLGISEGILIRSGMNFAQAREAVTHGWHDWLLAFMYALVGIAYIGHVINVVGTIGRERLANYGGTFSENMARTWNYMIDIHIPRASLELAKREALVKAGRLPEDGAADSGSSATVSYVPEFPATGGAADSGSVQVQPTVNEKFVTPPQVILNQNPTAIFLTEMLCGWFGFLGMGWFKSRRPAMALLFFVMWQLIFWVCFWALLTLLAPDQIPFWVGVYLVLPALSGLWAARSYLKRADLLKRKLLVDVTVTEGTPERDKVEQN
jgi:cytochrome c oxidase cbb3-type subunit 1